MNVCFVRKERKDGGLNEMWELDEALTIIRSLEPQLRKLNYFTSLTGSVLYNGQSKNDLDIMINLLGGLEEDYDDRCAAVKILASQFNATLGGSNYNDERREVYHGEYNGKIIDFIFFF